MRRRRLRRLVILAALVVVGLAFASKRLWHEKMPTVGGYHHEPERIVVCIDAGHPSESNSGGGVQNGTTEAETNWRVAQQLAKVLERNGRIKVVQPRRTQEQYMRNSNRAKFANDAGAAIVVHLHCDAGASHGFTLYYPTQEGHAENKVGPVKEVIAASRNAAFTLHKSMVKELDGYLADRGVKSDCSTRWGGINGALTSSIFSDIPTVTVEMVFLSNKSDAAFITSDRGRDKMAEALAVGIKQFVEGTGNRQP